MPSITAQAQTTDLPSGAWTNTVIQIPQGAKVWGIWAAMGAGTGGPVLALAYVGNSNRAPVFSMGGFNGVVRASATNTFDSINKNMNGALVPDSGWHYFIAWRNDTGATQTVSYGVSWE